MIARAKPARASRKPADSCPPRWTDGVAFVRSPDLSDETRALINAGGAMAAWDAIVSLTNRLEFSGDTPEIRDAARRGRLNVGVAALAEIMGTDRKSARRQVRYLETTVGLVATEQGRTTIDRNPATGKVRSGRPRAPAKIIQITLEPRHLRPSSERRRRRRDETIVERGDSTQCERNRGRSPLFSKEPGRIDPVPLDAQPLTGVGGSLERRQAPAGLEGRPSLPPSPRDDFAPIRRSTRFLEIDEQLSSPTKLVMACPSCGHRIAGHPDAAKAKANMADDCRGCGIATCIPAESVIFDAMIRIRGRSRPAEPAGQERPQERPQGAGADLGGKEPGSAPVVPQRVADHFDLMANCGLEIPETMSKGRDGRILIGDRRVSQAEYTAFRAAWQAGRASSPGVAPDARSETASTGDAVGARVALAQRLSVHAEPPAALPRDPDTEQRRAAALATLQPEIDAERLRRAERELRDVVAAMPPDGQAAVAAAPMAVTIAAVR